MTTSYHSFDVFDTLITRIVMDPKDVFLIMQERLDAAVPSLPTVLIRSFWGQRVWAEYSARRYSNADDITLEEIYGNLGSRWRLSLAQRRLLEALEMQVESDVLCPISGAARLVDAARKQGAVFFISDSYLPVEFIRRILTRYGFLKSSENLFVSGTLGRSKRSSRLFTHIMKELRVPASSLTHFGDNVFSDIVVPRRLGIHIHASIATPGSLRRLFLTYRERCKYALELLRARRLIRHPKVE